MRCFSTRSYKEVKAHEAARYAKLRQELGLTDG